MEHHPRPRFAIRGLCGAAIFLFTPAWPQAQNSLLVQWKQALAARFQFEANHPAAARLFAGGEPGAGGAAFLDSLRRSIWASDSSLRGWNLAAQALVLRVAHPPQAENLIADLSRRWASYPGFLHEAALTLGRANAPALARTARLALRQALLKQGYRRVPEFAASAIWEVRDFMREGRNPEALAALDFAAALDPNCPWIPLLRLENSFRDHGLFGVDLGDVWDLLNAVFGLQRFYDNQLPFLYNTLHGVRLGFMLFGFLCLLLLYGRHFTRLAHPLAERLPHSVDLRVRYAAIAMVTLSAAVAGAGFGLVALAVFPWIWPHANRGERKLMRWLMAGLFLLPPVLLAERSLLLPWDPQDGLNAYHSAYMNGFDPLVYQAIEGKKVDSIGAQYRSLALSLQSKKQGDYRRAWEIASTVSGKGSAEPLLKIHETNLALLEYDYAAAEKFAGEARPSASGRVELWFGASQAALFQNNSTRHKQYLDRAAEADAAALTSFLKENDELFGLKVPPNRRALDPMLRSESVFERIFRGMLGLDFLTQPMPGGLLPIPGGGWLVACVACLVAVFWRGRHNVITQGRALFECKICRKIMCHACRKGVHCESCFKTVSGVSESKMRVQLIQRLRDRSRSLSLVLFRGLNTLIPGGGWLFLGHAGIRAAWLLGVSMLLAWTYQMRHLVIEYPAFSLGALSALPWIFLILFYAVSLFASLLKRKGASPLPAEEGAEPA